MKWRPTALTFLFVVTAMADVRAADQHAALDRALTAIVNDATHPLASLSVLAIRHGKIVYHRQFGPRFIDPVDASKNKSADAQSLYRIASISKLVTALGVMKLVEAGTLSLDRDVSDYLGYTLRNPHFPDAPITLRMLLSHTSSLRDDAGYYWEAKLNVGLKDVLLPDGKLYGKGAMWAKNAKPGAYFEYANLPWPVIGSVMERATGERFDRLMQRLVLVPLGLHGGFHPADFSKADLDNTATLYRKRKEIDGKEIWDMHGPWVPQVDDYGKDAPAPRALPDYVIGSNGSLFGPQGNCRLSAAGLARIMLMVMNDGVLDGKTFLKKSSVAAMLKTEWRYDETQKNGAVAIGGKSHLMNAWGLGVHHFLDVTGPGSGDRLVEGGGFKGSGHLGEAWGLTSAMVFDRKTKNGMIFLSGGTGFDPEKYNAKESGLYRYEEQILTALYRGALAVKIPVQ